MWELEKWRQKKNPEKKSTTEYEAGNSQDDQTESWNPINGSFGYLKKLVEPKGLKTRVNKPNRPSDGPIIKHFKVFVKVTVKPAIVKMRYMQLF